MANEKNLRTPSSKEAREIGRKGGIASGNTRRKKRDIREWLKFMLEEDVTRDDVTLQGAAFVAYALMNKATGGDVQAIKTLLEMLYGTKQNIDLTSSDGSMSTPSEVILKLVKADAEKEA